MDDIISGIYCIENKISHKKYIGQSKNIKYRWKKHKQELNSNRHVNSYLQNSWNKYGQDNFDFYIIKECPQEDLDKNEKYYIEFYNTLDRDFGYNLKSGGQNGCYMTNEIKDKISKALHKAYSNTDLREQRSQKTKEYWDKPDNKKRILKENNVMYGKHHTDETKKKISETKKSRHYETVRKNHKKVFCCELNIIYDNATEAAKNLNLDSGGILKVCRGERYTCGGYHWSFVENMNRENNIS